MIENEYHRDIMQLTMQSLTFLYSIPFSLLNEERLRHEYPVESLKAHTIPQLEVIRQNYYKSLNRVMYRLVPEDIVNARSADSQHSYLSLPKIYDDLLFESQIRLYNYIAPFVGFPSIDTTRILPRTLYDSALSIDGPAQKIDYTILSRMYPYYVHGERKGLSFIEFILLLNICLKTKAKSVTVLNKVIDMTDRKQRARAKEWIKNLTDSIDSEKLYASYIDVFWWWFENKISERYNQDAENYARHILVPEKDMNVKDPITRYTKYSKSVSQAMLEQSIDERIDNSPSFALMYIERYTNTCALYEDDILFLARGISTGEYPAILSGTPDKFFTEENLTDTEIDAIRKNLKTILFSIQPIGYNHATNDPTDYISLSSYIYAHNISYIIGLYIQKAMLEAKELLRAFEEYKVVTYNH